MTPLLRIYLDTSVVSALVDPRDAGRQELTRLFWSRLDRFDSYACPIMMQELDCVPDPAKRSEVLQCASRIHLLPWTPDMQILADNYVEAGTFSPAMIQDARHVAACVVSGIPVLVSWNFRHLVNRTRRIRVNLVNSQRGYGQVEIVAPPELLD